MPILNSIFFPNNFKIINLYSKFRRVLVRVSALLFKLFTIKNLCITPACRIVLVAVQSGVAWNSGYHILQLVIAFLSAVVFLIYKIIKYFYRPVPNAFLTFFRRLSVEGEFYFSWFQLFNWICYFCYLNTFKIIIFTFLGIAF